MMGLNVVGDVAKAFAGGGPKTRITSQLIAAGLSAEEALQLVNQTQASHASVFVAGARPFTMWICNFGFLAIIVFNILSVAGIPVDPEILEELHDTVMTPLMALLGLGYGARTLEKMSGSARETLFTPKALAKAKRYEAETESRYGK